MSRPSLSQRLYRQAGNWAGAGDVYARTVGQVSSVPGSAGADIGKVLGDSTSAGGTGADSDLPVSAKGKKGRCCQPIPSAASGSGCHRVHWRGAGEGAGFL